MRGWCARRCWSDRAAAAQFVPLESIPTLRREPLPPFDVTVLGMGADGHTASFFPGGDRLAEALDQQHARPASSQ